jgi:hypothetical protein
MARIRSIKPDFFKHEDMSELPAMARLLFIGLWTQADRAGRLEDRPKRIKVEVFPYEEYDVEQGLALLEARGFIERYQAFCKLSGEQKLEQISSEEIKLIQITNFSKHQQPNVKEKESFFPAPCKHSADTPVLGGNVEGKGSRKGNGALAADAAGDVQSDKKNKKITPHWHKLKETWISFYKQHFNGIEPTFNGGAAAALKSIATQLQNTASKSPKTALNEWTEDYAAKNLLHFLTLSIDDSWRKQNFRLPVLSGHYDSIIQKLPHEHTTSKNGKLNGVLNADYKRDLAERMAKFAGQAGQHTG